MRMYDVILKKRSGEELSDEEIKFVVDGYVDGKIEDYQMSALLMAIYFKGMSVKETVALTKCMANSGEMIDLSSIPGIKVDKHSTGGVGDKTTLIISPIVASLGVPVAKMSGRGLGHTGGTVDKLESIPGLKMSIDRDKFFSIVRRVGVSVIGQSGNLVPADKKIYALRDVTATVDSIPLIASSVMSKKIAAGSDCILLDVKCGSGAFMKTLDDAITLARAMVDIGNGAGRTTVALVTDMDRPLGNTIGNSLEVIEACQTLQGRGPKDLFDLCVELSAQMLVLAGKGTKDDCTKKVLSVIENGKAFDKFKEMVSAQGGDVSVLDDPDKFMKANVEYAVKAMSDGYIFSTDAQEFGMASMLLGAGRETKDSVIDYSAGIVLHKAKGDYVHKGDIIATFYAKSIDMCKNAEKVFQNALCINSCQPVHEPIIFACVTGDEVIRYK